MSEFASIVEPAAKARFGWSTGLLHYRRSLGAAPFSFIGGAALLAFVLTFSMHLFNLRMHQLGLSAVQIGLSVALQGLGIFLSVMLTQSLLTRLGVRIVVLAGAVVCSLALLAMMKAQSALTWNALRLSFAFGTAMLLSGTELVVLRRSQGWGSVRIIPLYAIALSLGGIFGPLVLAQLDVKESAPFLIAAVSFWLVALPPSLLLGRLEERSVEASVAPWAAVVALPAAFAAALTFGMLDNGMISMLTVYGSLVGYDAREALNLVVAVAAGAIAIQYPLGLYSTRLGSLIALRLCATAAICLLAALPFVLGLRALALVTMIGIGGLFEGLYTIGLLAVAQRFGGRQLAAANACFISACALGEVAGPAITGPSMSYLGPSGLTLSAIVILAGFALMVNASSPIAKQSRTAL